MSCKAINSEENINIITTRTNEENESIEQRDEKLNGIVSNFLDSLLEEPSKEIRLKNGKDLYESRNKAPFDKNNSQNLSKSYINDSDLFEQRLKINKKKSIYEERLRIINQQISFLQQQKSKLNKELSLIEVNEKSLNCLTDRILKKEENINNENQEKDDDPENLIKFFNAEVDKSGGLYPFASEEIIQNNDNDLSRSSRSVEKDMRKEKRLTKDIKIINLTNIYNINITDFNSYRGYRNIILNKKHFNIGHDIILKSKFKHKG